MNSSVAIPGISFPCQVDTYQSSLPLLLSLAHIGRIFGVLLQTQCDSRPEPELSHLPLALEQQLLVWAVVAVIGQLVSRKLISGEK